MENIYNKTLHYLGKKNRENFIMNIGAMDGVLFDELNEYTNLYDFKGLYVEPIPYLYDRLKNNIKDGIFENSAISDYDGTIDMITINRDAIDNGLVHNCFYGMSAVYPPKNGLASDGDRETVEKYGEIIKVNCITWETLIRKHNITNIDVIKIDAEGHDFKIFKQIDLKKHNVKLIRIEWINLSKEDQKEIEIILNNNNFYYELVDQDLVAIPKSLYIEIIPNNENKTNKIATIVTGIWDIRRDSLDGHWKRDFTHYLNNFEKLLRTDINMIIFIESKYENFVRERRNQDNTLIVIKELQWFKDNGEIFNKIQRIRKDPRWYTQVGWLSESTQAKLEMYNPIVMSKMFLLNDARILDPFNSTHLIWIDGGITNTVHEGYFTHDKVLDKIHKYFNKFTFVAFPYDGKEEIHGFEYKMLCELADDNVNKVARGGIFGGSIELISTVNEMYYNLLNSTLEQGYMGTEESIFTILMYQNPNLFNYYEIEDNGLVSTFFENLKNDTLELKYEKPHKYIDYNINKNNVALYVLTYNSPKQFKTLIQSMLFYDRDFIDKPTKYLLNNSTDLSTQEEYDKICEEYNFTQIKKDNIGICGGRQFIAEHAYENNYDLHMFFEDDMFFYSKKSGVCRNGFNRYVDNFYEKILNIISLNNYDFLKFSYSEFYGDNGTQWAWYNVPQFIRDSHFPDYSKLPKEGLDPNSPRTIFKNIKTLNNLSYVDGEIYYSNWPQILTKEGTYKMFLETKFQNPLEQTWMSFIFQETRKGNIKPSLLLLSPTEHDRFDFYPSEERKEN